MTPQQIEAKIASYAAFHLADLVNAVKQMNIAFKAGQYEGVGVDACKVAQQIFGSSALLQRSYISDANANVCALITGVFT
jgi:hypothetical protein